MNTQYNQPTLPSCRKAPGRNLSVPVSKTRKQQLGGLRLGERRNAAAIGLINLIYNLARYEQIVRLKLLPRIAA
jgi:hypothetical protein